MRRHLNRLLAAAFSLLAVYVLGIVFDTAGAELMQVARDHGVQNGPFAPVLNAAEGITSFIIPFMIVGIVLWVIYGTVSQERREEVRRRIGP
ncbi:hypothetical protein SAMN06269185_1070 [Natronoarchaeum philippinense]|uniref:Uncharacterized protein n=1 Tax=Natronoarchaeum philippinense TaxID=558529 RepID=A0A285NET7_NATPI|nr:hypothetical protein [Natronoarchaeum philippinense]SNZ06161.1 hypothetical protein SAMN06269185_1070 [Natronoarchaeum philippinense]